MKMRSRRLFGMYRQEQLRKECRFYGFEREAEVVVP